MKHFSASDSAICRRIRDAVIARKMNRVKLSKESGVSYRLLYNIMHEAASPRLDTLAKLAPVLEVTVDYLQTGKERSVVAESTGRYSVKGTADTAHPLLPLHELVKQIAEHLNVKPAEISDAIFRRGQKDGGSDG